MLAGRYNSKRNHPKVYPRSRGRAVREYFIYFKCINYKMKTAMEFVHAAVYMCKKKVAGVCYNFFDFGLYYL